MAKDVKTKSAAGLIIIIVLAILVIINLISINLFSRVDLTDNKIYSLSESSRELVGKLNDRLTIKAFITEDLPAPHNGDARYLKDLLDDYKAYSHGHLNYEFIDPVKDNKEDEAMSFRVPPLQFNVYRNDKTEYIKGYKGVVLLYGDKQEVLPFIENTSNLEYDLSRAINKLTMTEIPTIAFTSGHGEPDMNSGINWANQMLQKEYRVQYLNLANMKTIPDNIRVLFIVNPKSPFNDWEQYLVDQFLMRGGKLAFLMDKFNVDVQKSLVTPVENGLDSMMYHYGAAVQQELVIDQQCKMIPVMRDMGQFQMQSMVYYPFFLAVNAFNPDNPIVKALKTFEVLFISPIAFNPDTGSETQKQVLFTSSEHSGTRSIPVDISPEKKYQDSDFDQKNLPLGAVLTGNFESYFNDRSIPEFSGVDTISTDTIPDKIDSIVDSRIVIIGNGSFIKDEYRRSNTSFVILLNIADWLTQDKGLISIRSKQSTARLLNVTSDSTKKFVKYLNMFAMPFLVILFGIIRWQYKKARRKKGVTL